ncbi:transmembrane protein [Ceratobasidium sp. AG-Ba]|nr:transmembrane protein [Ceratobasidium sp. AG-Ba]
MATATPQRAASASTSTPSTAGRVAVPYSPQTPTTFAYGGPARASSTVLPPGQDDSLSPQSRSRWTEHIEDTIVEGEGGEEEEDTTMPLPPAAAASLARLQRSSLPMPFELTDPADHDHDQDDTVRPGLGRVATTRSVRIMQPASGSSPQPQPQQQLLQVPRQSYLAPESRGTTPMPIRPASQLGLVTYGGGGRVRSPRFNAPGFDLKLTREPGLWARLKWRIGLPFLVFGPVIVQLFFDFCAVYTVVQAAAEPTFGQTSSRRNWSLAAAAYSACVLIWVIGVLIIYEAVYSFWRRWRVKRPLIVPIYLSTPARHLASISSFDVYCFFQHIRRTAWDAEDEVYEDDQVMDRNGAKGRIGNRSRDRLSEMWGHSREPSGGYGQAHSSAYGHSREPSRDKDHRRSDSGGMLMQPRESEDWKNNNNGGRESGMRRRSVGRTGGDEVRASLQDVDSPKDSPASNKPSPTDSKGHRRTPSNQTRFQELVHGPTHPTTFRDKKHRRSMSGRTSSEVERQLDIHLESRRVSASSSSSAAVGRVVSWVKAFGGHGHHVHPHAEKRSDSSSVRTGATRWTTDGLAEWFYARVQSGPTVSTLVPRAGISAAALFAFWVPQAGTSATGMRDGAFFRSNGTLTGFARGVLIANVAWILARVLLLLISLIGLWILSGQMCAGLCGPRYRWEEPLDEGEWDGEKDEFWGEPRDKLNWEWRLAARRRVQDAYELCMVRRRSTSWRTGPPPPSAPGTPGPRLEGLDKGKGRETPGTFGSTLGAAIVRERNSDQELALSGLRDERDVPLVEVTEHEGARRGILSAEMFTAPPATTSIPAIVPLVPPLTPSATTSVLPFPLQAVPAGTVLPSPRVEAVRKGSEPSAGRLTPPATSTSGNRTTPPAPGSAPGTSMSGSTPRGPSTATLVPMLTPRAGAARLESLSGSSVQETEEEHGEEQEPSFIQSGDHSLGYSGEREHSFVQSGEHSFSQSGEGYSGEHSFAQSGPGDRSHDSYAERFSLDDYADSQDGVESVRIRAPAAGSEADTSGSYSENIDVDTSASLSSLGQPISSRFFPISISRPGDRSSGSGGHRESGSGSGGNEQSPISSNNRSSSQGANTSGRRRQPSLLSSHDDSILSHNRDSIISHLPQTPASTLSRATRESILSRGAQESIISSPSPSVRSGLIPPPPPNPNRRRRMTSPSAASSSIDSLGVVRRRVGSHTFGPGEFGEQEGFEAEGEDSVGRLSTPSSRKNSLAPVAARRGRVSSGSGSGSGGAGSQAGSAGSRAVSASYSISVSGSGSASGGSVRRGSHSVQGGDEERDYTFGIAPPVWRTSAVPAQTGEGEEEAPPTAAQAEGREGRETEQR